MSAVRNIPRMLGARADFSSIEVAAEGAAQTNEALRRTKRIRGETETQDWRAGSAFFSILQIIR